MLAERLVIFTYVPKKVKPNPRSEDSGVRQIEVAKRWVRS
jgi:hypothetical protein